MSLDVRDGLALTQACSHRAERPTEAENAACGGIGKGERRASLHHDDTRNSPAAEHFAGDAFVVAELRQIPQIVGDKTVPRVEVSGTVTAPLIQLIIIGTSAPREGANTGDVSQGFAIGIGGTELHPTV